MNEQLYGGLPQLSDKVPSRRMEFASHCLSLTLVASSWQTCACGHQSKGNPTKVYVEVLAQDAGAESSAELVRCMDGRDDCKIRW